VLDGTLDVCVIGAGSAGRAIAGNARAFDLF